MGRADWATPKLLLPLVNLPCFILALICFTSLGLTTADDPILHPEEVKALKAIGKKIEKKDWDFGVDPCSGKGNWMAKGDGNEGFESIVICNCSFNNNKTCHVVSISLTALNISATLPPDFSKFRHLKVLDLSRNYFTGTIPREWTTLKLETLSFMGNRLSGPFPKVLTNITSLKNLSIEGNNFSGSIPPDIGKLINLQKLTLSSNAFSGELPVELAKLINLTDMRINDNNFSGKIPDFISNWKQIQKLQIQGSSLEGPIPSSISALTSLSDLRISDLKGARSPFPLLRNMDSLKTLILRNCLIYGEIPEYIGDMKKLKTLDLSYNNLTGEIPGTFHKLTKADFLYLTGNQLTGSVPQWIVERNKNADLSYNNFTWEPASPIECPRGSVNLVESYSTSVDKLSRVPSCLRHNFPCSVSSKQYKYSLHINCGGKELNISGDTTYEADIEPRGASMFYPGHGWALSSSGNFMDNDIDADQYIVTNTSSLSNVSAIHSALYTTARISPLSLTYYGLCLMKGNYTVSLLFAEIIFKSDRSFYSLGKRIFDVYIQDELVLKDFNIEEEAGGTGEPIVKNFTVILTTHTLKIHFYWAGRGTTGIPARGMYGPIISAISVVPNFRPPTIVGKRNYLVVVVGAISAAIVIALMVLGIFWRKGRLGGKNSVEKELRGLDLQTGIFSLRQIKAATKNFDTENKIGEGGFGCVYKGLLSDGTVIAVKQLSSKSRQGNREFVNEIGMISALQHPNLVKLYGCCVEGNQLLLVYEYMENNCLSRALFGKNATCKLKLNWPTRQKICLGIARGLAYLHEESRIKIVHRDIKTSNVLLDKDLNAKISDFGLAKLNEDDKTHISTRIAGTIGKSNTNYRPSEDFVYLLDWAYVLRERGSLLELVDPDLGSEYSSEEAMVMLNVALLCTNASPTLRPTMSQVVSMLEGRTAVQELLSDPGFSSMDSKFKALVNHFWQNPSQTLSMSTNGTVSDSASSNIEIEESRNC
ncbi:probable LRR receptor-like serine/threonine-protein kinase At1g07650 isoform X2 [Gossypium hirsutum]|uniref:non-specific serine/threonine protein kinase n=1 Tax=Gossypium hirsutum TaxID=3635 RepID=A0ABM2YSL9_GOSHI|nr:probable LRR receptor-like serine/threonine-protein kinase At1g07650 isoform X2 [Gossypium hirsutum]